MEFIDFSFWDFLDIFLTAFLFYNVYLIIKNTAAMKIFVGLASTYILWLMVEALKMRLLGAILGHVIGLGAMVIIIVFQQEIRKFFILLSSKYVGGIEVKIKSWFRTNENSNYSVKIWSVANACVKMSKQKTGALIILKKDYFPDEIKESGVEVDAMTTAIMLTTIFMKNGPMHDGAVIIENDRIVAAKCILPLSEKKDFPSFFGLRHRAAATAAEVSDSLVLTVSEETGGISWFYKEQYANNITFMELRRVLEKHFSVEKKDKNEKNEKLKSLVKSIKLKHRRSL